jgi:trehalose 6-phosphate phosphatase
VDRTGETAGGPTAEVRSALAPLLEDPATTAVMTDFDGTLSAIVDDPTGARPLEGAAEVMAQLAARFGVVAVVSGRPVSFLMEHLGGRRSDTSPGDGAVAGGGPGGALQFVGLYGLEWWRGEWIVTTDADAAIWRSTVEAAAIRLQSLAPAGATVEPKGLTVTLHWRTAPEAEPWARAAGEQEAERSGLELHPGRMSLELRPPVAVDKGTVVRQLAAGCSAACYLGDDLGDLPAFADLASLAGEQMATVSVAAVDGESAPEVVAAADITVTGPAGALEVLRWLARSAPSLRPS